jgi:hypothetical protein
MATHDKNSNELVRVNYLGTVGHRLRPKTPRSPTTAYGWETAHLTPGDDPTSYKLKRWGYQHKMN